VEKKCMNQLKNLEGSGVGQAWSRSLTRSRVVVRSVSGTLTADPATSVRASVASWSRTRANRLRAAVEPCVWSTPRVTLSAGKLMGAHECPVHQSKPVHTKGPYLTSTRGELGPQGWNLSPRGKVHPFVHPRGEHSLLFSRMEGQTENFTPRG
jgi:hypothetical protein